MTRVIHRHQFCACHPSKPLSQWCPEVIDYSSFLTSLHTKPLCFLLILVHSHCRVLRVPLPHWYLPGYQSCSLAHSPCVGVGHIPLPPSRSCPRSSEPQRGCCGQEPGGAGKAQPSTAWKTLPCSLGMPGWVCQGVNTSKARRRRGKEEIETSLSKKVQVGAISQLFEL